MDILAKRLIKIANELAEPVYVTADSNPLFDNIIKSGWENRAIAIDHDVLMEETIDSIIFVFSTEKLAKKFVEHTMIPEKSGFCSIVQNDEEVCISKC